MPSRIEKVASEVMGYAKAAKATVGNRPGVFKQLSREHGKVSALMLRVKSSSSIDVRQELFPQIRRDLLAHEKGELAEVYPEFLKHEALARYAEMHQREAGILERTIGRLTGIAYEDPEWESTFGELLDAVTRHVKEEENEYFPIASRVIGKALAEQMNVRYLAARDAAMTAS